MSEERIDDLVERLLFAESFVSTMGKWLGEPLVFRLTSAAHQVPRGAHVRTGSPVSGETMTRHGFLYTERGHRPVAELSATVYLAEVAASSRDAYDALLGQLAGGRVTPLGALLAEHCPRLERVTHGPERVSREDLAGHAQCLRVPATLEVDGRILAAVEEFVYAEVV
jgi:hypothetical protein